MNKFFAAFVVALLSVSIAAAVEPSSSGSGGDYSGAGGIYVYTDEASYAAGDTIVVTAVNKGTNYVSYTSCGGVFFSVTDSSGNEIRVTNPLLGRPCSVGNLYLRQSISYKWDQTYFDREGQSQKQLAEGTYVVKFLDATATFTVGKPSQTQGKLQLYTSKRNYEVGRNVEFIAYNGGGEATYYGACNPVAISDSNGNALQLAAPNTACIMIAYSLNPGEKRVITAWDQVYYACNSQMAANGSQRPAPSADDCVKTKATPGVYLADFNGAKTKFAIGPEANNQPPSPPLDKNSITIAFTKGWNMFSVPVYSWNGPICSPGERCPMIASYRAPVITENTCTPSKAWSYENSKYARTEMNSIQAGTGYWFRASQDCKITFEGDNTITASDYSTSLQPGWNLIGAPIGSISFSAITNDCRVTSGPWYYNYGEYHKYDSLDEGRAYWVKVANSCTLSMQTPVSAQALPTIPAANGITPVVTSAAANAPV